MQEHQRKQMSILPSPMVSTSIHEPKRRVFIKIGLTCQLWIGQGRFGDVDIQCQGICSSKFDIRG